MLQICCVFDSLHPVGLFLHRQHTSIKMKIQIQQTHIAMIGREFKALGLLSSSSHFMIQTTFHQGNRTVRSMNKSMSEEDSNDENCTRRTFCPPENRQSIIDMLERHYCAHPSIPGYAAPNPIAIKRWAVQQMYRFCKRNEIPEVWAYLWENWYREGRWNLWARSAHDLIPVLKTTMILESQ
jgi:hypothetical protein